MKFGLDPDHFFLCMLNLTKIIKSYKKSKIIINITFIGIRYYSNESNINNNFTFVVYNINYIVYIKILNIIFVFLLIKFSISTETPCVYSYKKKNDGQ